MRISTRRTQPDLSRTQGGRSNHKNLPLELTEPSVHGIGKSRGGLSSKIYAGVDGHGRPLSLVVTCGQRSDGAMLQSVLEEIHVPRPGPGRARTRLGVVLADRGYATNVFRGHLRERGVVTVIPERRDSIAARKR